MQGTTAVAGTPETVGKLAPFSTAGKPATLAEANEGRQQGDLSRDARNITDVNLQMDTC
jgi:hypothetical protein